MGKTKPMEYARFLQRVLDTGVTTGELCIRFCKPTIWLESRLSLNKLTEEVGVFVDSGEVSLHNAYAIAKLPDWEQAHWVKRGMSDNSVNFGFAINARVKEIAEVQQANLSDSQLGGIHPGHSREFKRRVSFQPALPKRPGPTIGQLINPSITKALDTMEKASTAFSNINPKPTATDIQKQITYLDTQLKEKSAYELLHGRKSAPKVQAKTNELIPLTRKGWDHVKGHSHNNTYAYCNGDWLVLYTGRCWCIDNPKISKLANLDFTCAAQAMSWIEENFKV